MNTDAKPAAFTAAQLAAATGRPKRAVYAALASVAPAGEAVQRGVRVWAWELAQLPQVWRDDLGERARGGGYRDPADFVAKFSAKVARLSRIVPGSPEAGFHLKTLAIYLREVRNPRKPEAFDLLYIFGQAFDEMAWLMREGLPERMARRVVLRVLTNSPVRLVLPRAALPAVFDRKLARWRAGGCKLSALAKKGGCKP